MIKFRIAIYCILISLANLSCTQSRPIDLNSLKQGLEIYYTDAGLGDWYSIDAVKVNKRELSTNGFELIELEYTLHFDQNADDYLRSNPNRFTQEFALDKNLGSAHEGEVRTIRELFKIKEFESSYTMEAASQPIAQ